MDERRLCVACGAGLVGPFQPEISLDLAPLDEEPQEDPLKVRARVWFCAGCGLAHWYADDECLAEISDPSWGDQALSAQPDSSYERRTKMLRMLRRVRRM
jgi:hypothetical protein